MTETTFTFEDEALAEFLAAINRAHLPMRGCSNSRVIVRVHKFPDGSAVLEDTLWTRPE